MNAPSHSWAGLWAHPRDASMRHDTPEYWTHLARTAERGKLDAVFLADVIGVYDVYGHSPDTAIRTGAQAPTLDPFPVVPLMAAVTENLGFGVTATLTYERPYLLARRFSTLDHLTRGRIAWNIVTGILDSVPRGRARAASAATTHATSAPKNSSTSSTIFGKGSWADDAVVRDRQTRVYTRPDRVRRVSHHGAHYDLDAIHLVHPSPQRTPFLFQAVCIAAGRAFAGGPRRGGVRQRAHQGAGRRDGARYPSQRRRAWAGGPMTSRSSSAPPSSSPPPTPRRGNREADYRRWHDDEGALALLSGWSGVDLSRYSLDERSSTSKSDAMRSLIEAITTRSPDRRWTVRDLVHFGPVGGRGAFITGSPTTVADELQAWVEQADVDGFNLVRS